MAHTNPLLGAAAHVSEHLVAITCVSGLEFTRHTFLEQFGTDPHKWPTLVHVGLAILIYLAGLGTTATIPFFVRRRTKGLSRLLAPIPKAPTPRTSNVAAIATGIVAIGAAIWLVSRSRPSP